MLDVVREWLAAAGRIAVLTGAGMSAESGVPTFRGPGGLWRTYRPEDLATPEAFGRDPRLVWEWYNWRRGLIAGAQPHLGHLALAQLENWGHRVTVVTQNVDGLHQRAGSTHVIEIHGSIWRLRCMDCRYQVMDYSADLGILPPVCPDCVGRLRPGVVWFGESLPPMAWEASVEAVEEADVLLVIGTSGSVYPAAQLAPIGRAAGARVVEINPTPSGDLEAFDAVLAGPCGELLPQLLPAAGRAN